MPEKKKMGRPTDSPKTRVIRARVDAETARMLDEYCARKQKTYSETIRDGIKRLYEDETD
ncbi:hypothetical protein DWV16_13770 [Anaerotruncus sp. AF02-27]|uniref:hypothetical protein n=1 Tax=Anaerotruncus TaxID=244127 RepID=UPI000E51ECE6|nr:MULTISPECIES: hypothetical protein [Anaerotruncus]RGX54453.1 hypothetical protein DWV16_13770 [Anaerotruncus sp. AF02-27]